MLIIARGWLVFDMTASPFQVTAVAAASQVPSLVLSVFGGVMADRFNRKTILITAEVINLITLIILASLVVTETVTFTYLMILATINGIIFALAFPARAAMVPSLVPRRDIANGVALSSMVFSGAQLFGPFTAGMLLAIFAPGVAFFAAAGGAALALPLFFMLKPREDDTGHGQPHGSVFGSIAEGLVYIRQREILLGLMALGFVAVVFGMPYQTVLPVFADEVLNMPELGLGYLGTAGGVGAIVGSLLVARFTGLGQMRFALAAGVIGMGVFIVLFSLSTALWLSLSMALMVGFFFQMLMTANFALLQVLVPDRLRGRVMSVRFIIFGMSPLGIISLGVASEMIGTPAATAWTGAFCAAAGMIALLLFPALRGRKNPEPDNLPAPPTGQNEPVEAKA
jgi:MFS family permease